jgi:hypothetical protein
MSILKTFVALGLAIFAAAAWGADYVVERAASPLAAPEPAATDATMELKWDSGFGMWWLAWYTGRDTWIGNDFDISTISSYRTIQAIKLQSRSNWPNIGWDGFRLGIFNFAGGVPGSLLWGPKFVVPTGSSGWKEFSVGWTLPSGIYKFLASQEQYYNWPNCEPFLIDNNPTFMGHSWMYMRGSWRPFESSTTWPYRNLMIRVIVNDMTSVTPTSLGRVKALYY